MRAVVFEGYELAVGRGQDYLPLPAHFRDGVMTTCWEVSDDDLAQIARTRRVWVQVLKGRLAPVQPMKLLAQAPDCSAQNRGGADGA